MCKYTYEDAHGMEVTVDIDYQPGPSAKPEREGEEVFFRVPGKTHIVSTNPKPVKPA